MQRLNSMLERTRHWGMVLVVGVIAALTVTTAVAQPSLKDVIDRVTNGSSEKAAAAEPVEKSADEYNRDTPRGAVEGFLNAAAAGDFDRAAEFLFLGRLPQGYTIADGPTLARQLKVVLDKTLWIDLASLSRNPEGKPEEGLPAYRDRVGRIKTLNGSVDVLLQRVRTDSGVQIWKFSSLTVAQIPALYAEFGYGPLGDVLPPFFFEYEILGLELWQLIGLPALVVVAYLVGLVLATVILFILRRFPIGAVNRLAELARGPLRLILSIAVFSMGRQLLNLSLFVSGIVRAIEQAFLIVAMTWVFLRLLDVAAQFLMNRLIERGQANVTPLLPPGRRVAQLVLVAIAVVVMLDNFGFNVTTLIAGLGVGGIAVALAAQKSIENLFGGLTLYADRPVAVGDFCRFGDTVGTVEKIGLRSTRVRTLERTVVSVPNAEFANLFLDNFTRRDKFWYHPTIGLRYETTPDQLRCILVAIREMLYAHPNVDPDPARVRFTKFSAYSLDLEIFAYVRAADYAKFLGVAEDLNLRIMDIVSEAGSSFAFPSQTTYVENGQPLDEELAQQATGRVQEWRQKKTLYLPDFPPQQINELKGTLKFPPEGAPGD